MSLEPVVRISALEHFVYCPRQCALVHGDQVWFDNKHIVRGERSHRRADSGQRTQGRGRRTLRSIPLWSEKLGLSGRADAVEFYGDGAVRPVEYKSGRRHGEAADLQVCAQGMCLEEMLGIDIPEGFVWHGGPRRRHKVLFDDELRGKVKAAVCSIRAQLLSGRLPSASYDERCVECQLRPHCLPDVSESPQRVEKYMRECVFSCVR